MSAPSSNNLSAGWHAELMPPLDSSSTTRTLGAPSGLTPCTMAKRGDRRTLLKSALASTTGAVIRDRDASASAPSWIADEFTSSRKEDKMDLLCSGEEVSKSSDDVGYGNLFAGPLPAWGSFPSKGAPYRNRSAAAVSS